MQLKLPDVGFLVIDGDLLQVDRLAVRLILPELRSGMTGHDLQAASLHARFDVDTSPHRIGRNLNDVISCRVRHCQVCVYVVGHVEQDAWPCRYAVKGRLTHGCG